MDPRAWDGASAGMASALPVRGVTICDHEGGEADAFREKFDEFLVTREKSRTVCLDNSV
jgi:hypothetical protein